MLLHGLGHMSKCVFGDHCPGCKPKHLSNCVWTWTDAVIMDGQQVLSIGMHITFTNEKAHDRVPMQ